MALLLFGMYALASPPAVSYHLLKKVSLLAATGGIKYFDHITVDSAGPHSSTLDVFNKQVILESFEMDFAVPLGINALTTRYFPMIFERR